MGFKSIFRELKRRNIYKVAVTYAITGWIILQISTSVFPALEFPEWTTQFVIILVLIGFPVALVFAWAFEITPEGLKRTREVPAAESIAHQTGKQLNYWIIGLLSLAFVLLLAERIWWAGSYQSTSSAPTQNITDRSIAVLPFTNHGGEGQADPLAKGIHDDLLTRLSNISDMRVVSRTSVEKYRDTKMDIPAIADSLDVRWILEGGVLEVGDQVKVNAQLIDPLKDSHIWAKDYQRKLTADNFFAIQGNITREIAHALQARLSANEQKRISGAPTDNLEAYRLYVKGRTNLNIRSEEGMRKAVDYFQRAIREDSTYALAWSGLADAIGLFREKEYASPERPLPDYEKTARKALELDPDLAEAHASMGLFYSMNYNGPVALKHLQRAVELKPSYAQAHHWLGWLLLYLGRPNPALEHLRIATDLNPNHSAAYAVLIWCLLANQQYEEALSVQRHIKEQGLYPESDVSIKSRDLLIHFHLKHYDRLRTISDQVRSESDDPPGWASVFPIFTYLVEGDTAAARQFAKELGKPEIMTENLFILAAMGENDVFYSKLDNRPLGETNISNLGTRYFFPDLFRSFREDPQFDKLIQKFNTYWGLNPDGSIPEEFDVEF